MVRGSSLASTSANDKGAFVEGEAEPLGSKETQVVGTFTSQKESN